MFVDASALTAIIAGEPEAAALVARLQRAQPRMTSPLAVWESVVALSRLAGRRPTEVQLDVAAYLALADVEVLAVPPEAVTGAVEAFERFGKGRHPAALNFGDCFAYACARAFRQPLLYKGDDFPRTDIEAA